MSFAATVSRKPSLLFVTSDEFEYAGVIKSLERDFDVSVRTSMDGALEAYANKTPDIILTSGRMGGGDGVKLIREIRKQNPVIPIVLLSGELEFIQKDAKSAGVTKTLGEPMIMRNLIRELVSLVPQTPAQLQ